MFRRVLSVCLLATIAAFAVSTAALAADEGRITEKVVAGGPDAFLEVRHVVIEGTNFQIGRAIAGIAKRMGVQMPPADDPLVAGVQRLYMQENYPIFYERMRGVADGLGLDINSDKYDLSAVLFFPSIRPGCSVVYYPAANTKPGHDMLSRNYDFTTGDLQGRSIGPKQLGCMARPYVMELHPDKGYASLAMCNFELLGGVLDGINSQGLAVAVMADDETMTSQGVEGTRGVGLHELAGMRYLLDNCKNVAEAKEALLSLKHYYYLVPCHYIIGDSSGQSFIFEFHPQRNHIAVVEGSGPQCATNHLVSRHGSVDDLPKGDSYDRFKSLSKSMTASPQLTTEEIVAANAKVAVPPEMPRNPQRAAARTIWYSLYDLDERTMKVKFYLGEKPDPASPGKAILQYSDYIEFSLRGQ